MLLVSLTGELAADLPGAAILGAVFLGLVAAAELWRRVGDPPAEWTRKLVHLGGGLTCLLFPFLVESALLVLGMAVAMTALFSLGARYGFLESLHGIARASRGAEYYPLAIFLVFLLAGDRPWLYVAAVLVLAVADACAALVGGRYGRVRYQVQEASKSLEGSLAFLVVAFLSIHLPVLLMTDLGRAKTVLAALLVAALVTGFEAISLRGTDNLFVPLAVVVILAKITSKPLAEVVFQNLSLAALCVLIGLAVRRFRSFNTGGAIAFILFTYGTWSLGSWHWALPVLAGFGCFALAWLRSSPARPVGVRTREVARALLVPFLILAVANGMQAGATLFGPYLAACGVVLALSLPPLGGPSRAPAHLGAGSLTAAVVSGALLAWAVTALPPWLAQPSVPTTAPAAAGAAVLLASLIAAALQRLAPAGVRSHLWSARRFLLSLGAALAVLALQTTGLIAPWDPSWIPRLGLL